MSKAGMAKKMKKGKGMSHKDCAKEDVIRLLSHPELVEAYVVAVAESLPWPEDFYVGDKPPGPTASPDQTLIASKGLEAFDKVFEMLPFLNSQNEVENLTAWTMLKLAGLGDEDIVELGRSRLWPDSQKSILKSKLEKYGAKSNEIKDLWAGARDHFGPQKAVSR